MLRNRINTLQADTERTAPVQSRSNLTRGKRMTSSLLRDMAKQTDKDAVLSIIIRVLGFAKSLLEKYRKGEEV